MNQYYTVNSFQIPFSKQFTNPPCSIMNTYFAELSQNVWINAKLPCFLPFHAVTCSKSKVKVASMNYQHELYMTFHLCLAPFPGL